MGSPCYFLSSRGQKIKNITKTEQKRLFLCTFLVSLFMAFLAQKLIYTISIWFDFVFGSFLERSFIKLNYFTSLCEKMTKMYAYFKTETNVASSKSDRWFFSNFHCQKAFPWEKNGGTGLISEKAEDLYTELNKRVKAATSSFSATGDFLQYIYSVLVAKNHQNIW